MSHSCPVVWQDGTDMGKSPIVTKYPARVRQMSDSAATGGWATMGDEAKQQTRAVSGPAGRTYIAKADRAKRPWGSGRKPLRYGRSDYARLRNHTVT
jgi:hypothetical protein